MPVRHQTRSERRVMGKQVEEEQRDGASVEHLLGEPGVMRAAHHTQPELSIGCCDRGPAATRSTLMMVDL